MNANGNAIAKPIIQLLIHILKKLLTNPAFAAVMTNDMKNDINNAMQSDVKSIRFLLKVILPLSFTVQSFTVSSALCMHFVRTE